MSAASATSTMPEVEVPEVRTSPAAVGHAHLVEILRHTPAADEFGRYRLRGGFRLARHLQRCDEIGDAVVDADLDDLHELLGHTRSWGHPAPR